MTQPVRKTYLPQNKFYSGAHVPEASDEAGASSPAPTPDAPADISDGVPCCSLPSGESDPSVMLDYAPSEAVIDSCQEPMAADLLQALGALSGTDLIHEIFAVKPKHFKLKHKRRIALPRFAPDYEAMESAMHDRNAPRVLADDPVWADPAPIFLRDRA